MTKRVLTEDNMKKLSSFEYLNTEYKVNKKTITAISKELGVGISTVTRALANLNIRKINKIQPQVIQPFTVKALNREQKLIIKQELVSIAKKYNISPKLLKTVMRDL